MPGQDERRPQPDAPVQDADPGPCHFVADVIDDHALAIGRAKQENKEGYASRLRGRLKAEKEAKAKKG